MPVPLSMLPGYFDENRKFHRHKRVAKLIQANRGRIMKFRHLPREAQMALVQYMAIDGEAWDVAPVLEKNLTKLHSLWREKSPRATEHLSTVWASILKRSLPFYVKHYGEEKMGYVPAVPMADLIAEVMKDLQEDFPGNDWKRYHEAYMNRGTKHGAVSKNQWPVIFSGFDNEMLQDGWTRLHQYSEKGLETTPALFYPPNRIRK